MKMRKLLALVLCLCLVLPLCSAAFATGNEGELNTDPTATPVAENPPAETPVPPAETPVPPAVDDPEPDACTCGAEEGAAHAADCPLSTAPGAASPSPAADPAEPTPAVSCTCDATDEEKAAEGFLHAEGCPLNVEPDASLYDRLMAAKTLEEFMAIVEQAAEEELNGFTCEEFDNVEAHYIFLSTGEYPDYSPVVDEVMEIVNFTNVAPLVGAGD